MVAFVCPLSGLGTRGLAGDSFHQKRQFRVLTFKKAMTKKAAGFGPGFAFDHVRTATENTPFALLSTMWGPRISRWRLEFGSSRKKHP